MTWRVCQNRAQAPLQSLWFSWPGTGKKEGFLRATQVVLVPGPQQRASLQSQGSKRNWKGEELGSPGPDSLEGCLCSRGMKEGEGGLV